MVKFGLIDRIFRWIEKHKWPVGVLALALLALSYWFRAELGEFAKPHEAFFKLLGLILGPFATVIGFYLAFKAKEEMVRHTGASEDKLIGLAEKSQTELLAQTKDIEAKARSIAALETRVQFSTEQLARSEMALAENAKVLASERERVTTLDANLRRVTDGGHNLWQAYPARPFPEYYEWLRAPEGAKIITVGNLKGGVGKTTIAANLAAYISKKRDKPVLVIDLDYQGSLSNMMMFAAGKEDVPSNADMLLLNEPTLSTLADAWVHLTNILPNAWLVPASYTFGAVEGRLLLSWLMEPDQSVDARYRLARLLLSPDVRKRYSAIILDMPPRLTLGSVNAMVASHYLIVPSALDRMSTEALRQFLVVAKGIKSDLNLDIDLLGAIGTLSRLTNLDDREKLAWKRVGEHCEAIWEGNREYRFARTVPRKTKIAEAAGEAIAYLSGDASVRSIFNDLGDEIWERIHGALYKGLDGETSPQFDHPGDAIPPPESG